jgi:hypothetical protein
MKPIMARIRQQGVPSVIYIDDLWLKQDMILICARSAMMATTILADHGLIPHPVKSRWPPMQRREFLGFLFDSVLMAVFLTPEKVEKVKAI